MLPGEPTYQKGLLDLLDAGRSGDWMLTLADDHSLGATDHGHGRHDWLF